MKKVLALLLILVMTATMLFGCTPAPDASYAITATVNGEQVKYPVGPYRYYVQWMTDYYYAYINTVASQMQQKLNWEQVLASTDLTAPLTLSEFIINNAKEQYMTYLYIEQTFDDLGLSLTPDDEKTIDKIIQTDWVSVYGNDGFNTVRQKLGLTYDEFRNLIACNLKSEKITEYYYGKGGPNEVTDQEKKDYFEKNYVRFKYVVLMLEDSEGNAYNKDKVASQKALRDAAVAELDAGALFEDVLKKYSDDYKEISDDLTSSEKEAQEKQNTTMVEDGLIINEDGVFSQDLATYYNITVDSNIVNKVFALKDGEYATVELKDSIWIVKRYVNNEKEQYFTDVEIDVFRALYADDLSAKHTEWRNRLNYIYNEAAVELYKPENLTDLFKFSN